MDTVTEAELLEEIRRAFEPGEREAGALTGPEIAEALGCSTKTLQPVIRRLVRAGALDSCRIPIVDSVGRSTSTWAYRLTPV